MAYEYVIERRDGRLAWLVLNRPKANALSRELVTELRQAVRAAQDDSEVRCILIHGGEGKFFSAGADIPTFQAELDDPFGDQSLLCAGLETMDIIERCVKPVVAVVNGFAFGGGCELALACHLRIASEDARFGQPEVNLGLMPGWGGTFRLARAIGYSRALDWALTGRAVNAAEAYAAGLLHAVAPAEQLVAAATELGQMLAKQSPSALRIILDTAREQYLRPAEAKSLEAQGFARCTARTDAREGVAAFLEKRAAMFTGE